MTKWTAKEWNHVYPVGAKVRYTLIKGRPDFIETVTRSEAWTLGHGEPVVSLEGKAGGIALSHLEVLEDTPTPKVDDSRPDIEGELRRADKMDDGPLCETLRWALRTEARLKKTQEEIKQVKSGCSANLKIAHSSQNTALGWRDKAEAKLGSLQTAVQGVVEENEDKSLCLFLGRALKDSE